MYVIETEIHRSNCILSNIWYRSIFSDDKRCARESIKTIVEQMQQEAVQKADGLIVIGKCNKEALLEMKQHYHSVVCVNRNATSGITDEVICDGRKIAQMAVEYLIGLGHQKIGYVGACGTNARYQGYLPGRPCTPWGIFPPARMRPIPPGCKRVRRPYGSCKRSGGAGS